MAFDLNNDGFNRLPLVSIITVVKNAENTIFSTLQSVQNQLLADFEHIVIDGNSTDATRKLLATFNGKNFRWVSEKDLGIYDAMNKGISLARGQWLYFLGGNDVLSSPFTLSDLFVGRDLTKYDLICGCITYLNGRKHKSNLSWRILITNTIHHQAAFYRSSIFRDFRYRLDIPVVADYEVNYLMYKKSRPALVLNHNIAICDESGVSHKLSKYRGLIYMFNIRSRHINIFLNCISLIIGLVILRIKNFRVISDKN